MKTPLISLTLMLALFAGGAHAADKDKLVTVENTSADPVPTTQVGTSSVAITNTPAVTIANVPTVNVASLPAITVQQPALMPFQGSVHITIAASSNTANGVGTITVPAGMRAVIETVSISTDSQLSQTSVRIATNSGQVLGSLASFVVPMEQGAFGLQATSALKLYADSGASISCEVTVAAPAGQIDGTCNFSGYLVEQQ